MIDVGCGTGANLAALADRFNCVGIDTSAEAVELAQQRFPQAEFRVGYAPDDLGDLMPRANLVMLMDVLEHVEDDVGLLSSLIDAAEPGCHFLVTVPADPRSGPPTTRRSATSAATIAGVSSRCGQDSP